MVRFKRHIQFEHGMKPIELTPLVDIVFLLLIFFMLTSQFVVQMGFPIKLPKAVTGKVLSEVSLVIVVSRQGAVYYKGKPITFKELEDILEKHKKDISIFVKADKNARLESVVRVWDLCRKKGIEKVHIATQK